MRLALTTDYAECIFRVMPTGGDIKRLREKRLRESQAKFALRFGVDQTTIHRWEKHGLPERGFVRKAAERILEEIEAEVSR